MALVRRTAPIKAPNEVTVHAAELMERLRHAGLLQPPVDVYAVAEFLGLEIVEEVMDDEMSGYIEPRRGGWIIGVNKFHHPNRQRFTIAHEIGHFVLHRPSERVVDVTFARRLGARDKIESEADQFASNLLMPAEHFRGVISGGEYSLEKLASVFSVSVLAAKVRAQTLGYSVR